MNLYNLTLRELALPVFLYFFIYIVAKAVPNMQDLAARISKLAEALFFVMADEGVLSPGL